MIGANFRYQVLQIASRMVKYASLSNLGNTFGYGSVQGPVADGSLGQQQCQQPVRFMQWFGFRSRPVVKQGEAVVVACRGGTSNAVAVAADNLAHGPTDLDEGESVMYSSGGSTIRQDTAGKITINAKAPADVVVNGGTLKVARATDPVYSGAITVASSVVTTMGLGSGNVVLSYTSQDGATTPLVTMVFAAGLLVSALPTAASALVSGRIQDGAPRFKA